MFRSRSMRKVELIVPEHDIVSVTEALADSQVFHVMEPEDIEAGGANARDNPWSQKAATYASLEQRILDVMELLGVEAGTPPEGPLHLIEPDLAEHDIDTLEQEAKGPVRDLEDARKTLDRLERLQNQITSLVGLDIQLQAFRTTEYLFTMLGSMPIDHVERLETSLEHIPSALVVLQEKDHLATVALLGLRRDADVLQRAARSAYLNPFELPSTYDGTPEEVLKALDTRIGRTREHVAEYQSTVHYLHETRIQRLQHLIWRVRASRTIAETIAGFKQFQYTYLAVGWVPLSKVADLRERIVAASGDAVIEVLKPTLQEERVIPFDFANPPLIRLFEPLVTTYGYPKYRQLDPTPLLALTFPLIFGLMFGDVGHGLLLVLLGALLLSRKLKPLKQFSEMGGIVVACGMVATIFGFFYGSLFGFEDLISPLWLRPLERTTDILLFSVGFGVVILTLGMVLNIIDALRDRRWGEALFDRHGIAGLLFYWSLIGLGAQLLNAPVPVSGLMLSVLIVVTSLLIVTTALLSPLIEGERPDTHALGMTLFEGFFELFETLLSSFSNTLSYVRMGAFAVAHGALSMVIFILARMISPNQGVGYWLVVALGNLVIIGFEGMIVAIQTLRLEYYEFFSKFFVGGGKPYRPLVLLARERQI